MFKYMGISARNILKVLEFGHNIFYTVYTRNSELIETTMAGLTKTK